MVYGCNLFFESIKHIKIKKYLQAVCICLVVSFVGIGTHDIFINWEKDDIRGVVQAWYDNKGYEAKTIVHQWSDANFQYYLQHNEFYKNKYEKNILDTNINIRKATCKEMEKILKNNGVFDFDKFYYVGPCESYKESYQNFINVMLKHNYVLKTLFSNHSVLILCKKLNGSEIL